MSPERNSMMFFDGSRWKPYSAFTFACSASTSWRSRWCRIGDASIARHGGTKLSSISKPDVAVRRTRTSGTDSSWSRGSLCAISLTCVFRNVMSASAASVKLSATLVCSLTNRVMKPAAGSSL